MCSASSSDCNSSGVLCIVVLLALYNSSNFLLLFTPLVLYMVFTPYHYSINRSHTFGRKFDLESVWALLRTLLYCVVNIRNIAFILLQVVVASYDTVFPAVERDVKDVDDNCELVHNYPMHASRPVL